MQEATEIEVAIWGEIERMMVDLTAVARFVGKRDKDLADQREEEVDCFVGELAFRNGENNNALQQKHFMLHKYDLIQTGKKNTVIKMAYISAVEHVLGNSVTRIIRNPELKDNVVSVLQGLDPNIIDLRIIKEERGADNLVIEHKLTGYMPLSTYGDGIKKIIVLANGIAEAKDGILLIDEIETSIHASALQDVLQFLFMAGQKFNVQLFITTHNQEVVDTILKSDKKFLSDDPIRIITLAKQQDKTLGRILDGAEASKLRFDHDMELR